MTTVRHKVAATLLIAIGLVLLGAGPASAHSVAGVKATNFETRFAGFSPRPAGVNLRVVEAGSRLELSNTTRTEAVVLGYMDEPYLRVGPKGVFENLRSPATYVNRTRQGTAQSATIPTNADPEATPRWRKVSDDQVARWHDHRAHFMGEQAPPAVRRDPTRPHVIVPEWNVEVRYGQRVLTATGSLVWVPPPSPVPWLMLALILLVGTTAAAFSSGRNRLLALLTTVLVAVDIVHAVGNAFANAGTVADQLRALLGSSTVSVVGWVVGLAGLVALARNREEGVVAAGVAGLFAALIGGIVDYSNLDHAIIPFAYGSQAARVCVAVSLGLGVGLAVASVVVVWRGGLLSTVDEWPAVDGP